MTIRFKPLKCTFDVSVHGAFGAWSWAVLTSRFIARGVRHHTHLTLNLCYAAYVEFNFNV